MINKEVKVIVDRPLNSTHPKYSDMIYPINYGYIEGIIAGDNEEQDAYILGVDVALCTFDGVVVAIIHRLNDIEEKWVVAPKGMTFTIDEIKEATDFCEKYFEIEIKII